MELKVKKNKILGSPQETEIIELRESGKELQEICDFMQNERNFKISAAGLSRYFKIKKQIGPIAVEEIRNHLKTQYQEEYMDLAGRITFMNEVILEAKKRFNKEKNQLTLSDLLAFAGRFSDSLSKIEGADAQSDLIRDLLTIIHEVKTTPIQHSLPIVEIFPSGEVKEVGRSASADPDPLPAEMPKK